ncbi:triosephosphate isomerase [Niveomyces insectorum RCEF 264]|uniref:Triosephosphate isomerase n=1 Tax=Niveomyces insectorum RCEF 264 TaxID=1081102 RepID=A0A167XNT2_9HYPO|nr:triosephosphate isomerase [Niveomyces insectorum RCEF 264]
MAAPVEKRRPILGVSTKMYFSVARTREYVDALGVRFAADNNNNTATASLLDRLDVFVIPDFVTLSATVAQLRAVDARPRRETDATTAAKAAAAARHGLVPLVCVGEVDPPPGNTTADGGHDATAAAAAAATVLAQVTPVLAAVPDDAEVLIAYEPVWAIGAAQPASAAHVRAVVSGVRVGCAVVSGVRAGCAAALQQRGGGGNARMRILYGGSAGPGLFKQLAGVVDGLFLGRFGHDPDAFMQTAREIAETV